MALEQILKLATPFFLALACTLCQAQSQLTAQDALKLAAQNRPALSAARHRVESAKSAARALGTPAPLEFGIGASTRNDVGATDQDLFLSQSIDLFGRRSASKAVGEAGVQMAIAEFQSLALEMQTELLTAYAKAVAAKHHSEVATELLSIAEGLLNATKRRFDEGKIAEIQVTRANIEFSRAKLSNDLRTAEYLAAMKRLAGFLGSRSDGLVVQSDAPIEPLTNPKADQRPDMLEQRALVVTAEAEARFSRASNRPELNLQLVRSPWGNDRSYFVGRVQFTWAIFDHGRSRSDASAAQLRADYARKLLQDTEQKAASELEAAQIELNVRQSRIKSFEAILVSARDLVAKSQKGFAEGVGTQVDVLEATRALREVEQELVEARQQLSLAVIEQYRAAGYVSEVLK